MSIKEQLVGIVQAEGYDFMTACELVSRCMAEFAQSGRAAATYYIGKSQFTLRQKVKP